MAIRHSETAVFTFMFVDASCADDKVSDRMRADCNATGNLESICKLSSTLCRNISSKACDAEDITDGIFTIVTICFGIELI